MTNHAVEEVVQHLRDEFPDATVTFTPDEGGGGNVIIEPVQIPGCTPASTWLGANLGPLVPLADIYPVFIGADVKRRDNTALSGPLSASSFAGRPAIQVSRRTHSLVATPHAAALKFRRVLDFIKGLAA